MEITGKLAPFPLLQTEQLFIEPAIVEIHPGRLGNRIHNALVIRPEDLVRVPRSRVVVSVAGVQARHEIRRVMARLGFVELHDFVCAA